MEQENESNIEERLMFEEKCKKLDEKAELQSLVNELYKNILEALTPVVEAIKKLTDSLPIAFLKAWEKVKFSTNFLDKNISRKRFSKLLMAIGYQRNEINKIVWECQKKEGKYTIKDYLIARNKKEEN